jgi:hypothetical protein
MATAYPVYLTIANIDSATRNSPSKNAMRVLAHLPVPSRTNNLKTLDRDLSADSDYNDFIFIWLIAPAKKTKEWRTYSKSLIHAALRFIFEPLASVQEDGLFMYDPAGNIRLVVPKVRIWMADYPEQVLLSQVKSGLCACCMAGTTGMVPMGDLNGPVEWRDLRSANEERTAVREGHLSEMDLLKDKGIHHMKVTLSHFSLITGLVF